MKCKILKIAIFIFISIFTLQLEDLRAELTAKEKDELIELQTESIRHLEEKVKSLENKPKPCVCSQATHLHDFDKNNPKAYLILGSITNCLCEEIHCVVGLTLKGSGSDNKMYCFQKFKK